jgi:hypothetical protein
MPTALVVALLLGGCATVPLEPWILSSDEVRAQPVDGLRPVSSYPQALAATLDVVRRELGAPPFELKLVFLPDSTRLEAALRLIGHPPKVARDASRQMVSIASYRAVLVNQRRLEGEGWPRRVAILGHELGHVLQYEWAAGIRGASSQWLREGFAEWLELRVLAVLDGSDEVEAREEALVRVRSHTQMQVLTLGAAGSYLETAGQLDPHRKVPRLSALRSFPEWVEQTRGAAGPVLYDYALLAMSSLLDRHGLPAVVRYFELFAERQDAAANFLEAFGETEEELEARLRHEIWP